MKRWCDPVEEVAFVLECGGRHWARTELSRSKENVGLEGTKHGQCAKDWCGPGTEEVGREVETG